MRVTMRCCSGSGGRGIGSIAALFADNSRKVVPLA